MALTAAAIAAWLSSGCDRLRPAKEVADSPAAQQPAPPPETVVPESLPASPEGAIAAFEQLQQPMRNDDRLKSLAETPGAVEQIMELNLRDSAVTDIGAALLPKFTAVTRLDLTNARISSGALTQIAQMPALTTLVIDAIPLGVEPLAELPKLTGLRELSLARTAIEDQAFESLAQIEGLQSLDVSYNERLLGTTFSELVKQGRFAELTTLAASESQFGVAGLKQIGRLKQLQTLRLANSGVSDDALQGVASCTELRTLALGGNPLTGPGLKHLSRLHQLKELKLGGCTPLADGALNHLRGQNQLERLELDGTTCTPAAVQELKDKFLMGTIVTFGGKEL